MLRLRIILDRFWVRKYKILAQYPSYYSSIFTFWLQKKIEPLNQIIESYLKKVPLFFCQIYGTNANMNLILCEKSLHEIKYYIHENGILSLYLAYSTPHFIE